MTTRPPEHVLIVSSFVAPHLGGVELFVSWLRDRMALSGRPAVVLGLLVFVCVAVCTAAAWPSTVVAPAADRPAGDSRWTVVYAVALIAAFVSYGAALWPLGMKAARLLPVVVIAIAIQLTPVASPLTLSTDAYSYWMYGRISAIYGGNPYVEAPSAFPADIAYPYVGSDNRSITSPYGPLFTAASEPIALAAGNSAAFAAFVYKLLAGVGMVLVVLFVAYLTNGNPFAVGFVGWNPVLAVQVVGGGHNDVWMISLVLLSLCLAKRNKVNFAGVAWALAVLVKWVPLLLLPLYVSEARANRRRIGWKGLLLGFGVAGMLTTLRYGPSWTSALSLLGDTVHPETAGLGSSHAGPAARLIALGARLIALGLPDVVAVALPLVLFGAAYLWMLRRASRGASELGLAMAAFLLATPKWEPWYLIWLVPLASIGASRMGLILAVAFSLYCVNSLGDAGTIFGLARQILVR